MQLRLTSTILFFFLLCNACVKSQQKRNCNKSFVIKQRLSDGSDKKVPITIIKRFYDFSKADLENQNKDDAIRYAGFNYRKIGEPSQQVDCAGYVFNKIWHKGNYFMTAETFYESIVKNFGAKVSGEFTWGDVKTGDVVVYINPLGKGNHIAIVTSVLTNYVGQTTDVIIETKDGIQGAFMHYLPGLPDHLSGEDPLVKAHGFPVIYRLNPSQLYVNEMYNGDCDDESAVKAKEEKYYITKEVTLSKWVSTGVHVKKGAYFRVEASDSMFNPNAGINVPKYIHPYGYGYWHWYVLSVRIGKNVIPVGDKADGSGVAPEEGEIYLGAPRSQNIFEGDGKDVIGSWKVKVYATDGELRETNTEKTTINNPDTKIRTSSNEKLEKAKKDLETLKNNIKNIFKKPDGSK